MADGCDWRIQGCLRASRNIQTVRAQLRRGHSGLKMVIANCKLFTLSSVLRFDVSRLHKRP